MFSDTWKTMEMSNTEGKHRTYFRLESLKEQLEKLLKEALKLSNLDKEAVKSGSTMGPFQATFQKEGVSKARKPPLPPPRKPKVEQTCSSEDPIYPIYTNHYSPLVNDSVNLNLLRDKYVELEHEITNLNEMIKAEVDSSPSNKNYQAISTIQHIGESKAPLQLVKGLPHSANRFEEQREAFREIENGGVNKNNFYPYYFSDPNNDSFYKAVPRDTMTVEILQKQVKEALNLIEITIESSQNNLVSPNANKQNKPQNFEETRSCYSKRAPPPIPRQNVQSIGKLEIYGSTSEELEQEEGKCLIEPVYNNTSNISSNYDVYPLKEDDPYYSSVPMTGSLMEDKLEKIQREATLLNKRVETVVKDNKQHVATASFDTGMLNLLGSSPRRKDKSCNLEEETDFKSSSQELLQEAEQTQIETEYLKAMLRQTRAENKSLKTSLQQAKDELERRMVLSNIPDELQAKKDIDNIFQRMKSLEKENKEREEHFQKAKRNYAELLANCTVKTNELLTENEKLIEKCRNQQIVLDEILSIQHVTSQAKSNGYKACFKKIDGKFGFSCIPKNGRIFLGESNIILREIKTQHLVNTEECTESLSENDFIMMVENIDVSSYDKKKFDELIQVGFREKELLNITLCKARSKPSKELEVELRNVPAMKEGEISLAMVFRNKTGCINDENSVIKCYDIIEKIGDKSVNCYLNDALKQMNKKGSKTKIRRYFDTFSNHEDSWQI